MSKTAKFKLEFENTCTLVEIFSILKDVATNRYYTVSEEERFTLPRNFFTDFFQMASLVHAESPMVKKSEGNAWVLLVTSEGSFMASMISKVIKSAMQYSEQNDVRGFIVIGDKARSRITGQTDKEIVAFTELEKKGLYEVALEVKDHIVEKCEEGEIANLIAYYPKAMNVSLTKVFDSVLLPAEELLDKKKEVEYLGKNIIIESDPDAIIHYLGGVWLTVQLYDMLRDCYLAGFAAQNQQLEASVDELEKQKLAAGRDYRKSSKSDQDNSLREVFTAAMMADKGE